MKIYLTPTGGTPFILGDDSVLVVPGLTFTNGAGGQIKEGFVNKQTRVARKTPLFRAPYLLCLPRFNWGNHFSCTVQRSFQSVEACLAFIAFHPDSVPAQGEITMDNQSSAGRILRYLPNAVIETVECTRQIGLSCDFKYTVAGNGPWQISF